MMFKAPFKERNSNSVSRALPFVFFLALTACNQETEVDAVPLVRPVKIMTISADLGEKTMTLPGRVRAARRIELSFKVAGPLDMLPIEEGQFVKTDQLIARILPRDFETTISEARARALESDQQYERYQELYAKKLVSKAEYDKYRSSRNVAQAQLKDAQNALKDTRLTAPFDGVISKRFVENFEKVQINQPIVNLQQIDHLEILIDLPELIMSRFKKDRKGSIVAIFDAAPDREYPLKIKEFSTEADPSTGTYQVVLLMAQPKNVLILPGMTARVRASTKDKDIYFKREIVIPAISVLNDGHQKSHVWLVDRKTMRVSKKEIKIGSLADDENLIVTEGLKPGDKLVVAGVTKLREGMKVRLWEDQKQGQ